MTGTDNFDIAIYCKHGNVLSRVEYICFIYSEINTPSAVNIWSIWHHHIMICAARLMAVYMLETFIDHYDDVIMETITSQNHQPQDCLLNRSFGHRSKKTSKFRVTGLCVGNSPVTGEFPAQMASNAENVSIWWRHHALFIMNIRRTILLHVMWQGYLYCRTIYHCMVRLLFM